MKRNKTLFFQICILIIALNISYFLVTKDRMSTNWMGPYLSAAHNLELGGTFDINLDEVKRFNELEVKEQDFYKFKKGVDLVHYNHNPIGYAYIINFAKILFPYLGDQLAILLLQCIVYLLINLMFLSLKELSKTQKWLFFIFFSLNPIILRFVPFNFYYFWQIIPSVIFAYLMIVKTPKKIILTSLLLILPIIVLTRPSIILTLFVLFFIIFKKFGLRYTSILGFYNILIIYLLFQPIQKNIWHTVYTGFGAYENEYDIKLNDNSTYDLYEKEIGEKLNASVGGNYYEQDVIDKYKAITKAESLTIIRKSPFMILKNAILNTLEGFSIGYMNKAGDMINFVIAFSGIIVVALLLYYRMFLWFLMISVSIGTFTLYYPPIPAYMYGVYLMIILSFISELPKQLKTHSFFKTRLATQD